MSVLRFVLLGVMAAGLVGASAQVRGQGKLRVFFVDVEGGQATLFVTPSGESLLIDTGWQGNDGRDADRIARTAREAGVTKIDYVLVTHYHEDHVGGVPQLVARIPVGTFLDHGPNREMDHGITEHGYAEYQKVLAAGGVKHRVMKPGETLPIKGMTATVISADGKLIDHALAGGGQRNEFCASSEVRPADQTENARSLGIAIQFGKLRLLDLGDLTWDKERVLMCPVNKLGRVDVLIVSHHGWLQSSSPALVRAVRPRVAVMDNGETKGGSPGTFDTLASSAGLEALYQLHYSAESGGKNGAEGLIANPQGTDAGYGIELVGGMDGGFEVTNGRTRETRMFGVK